jgi:hypothetical protein
MDIQTREAYINRKATVTLFSINPPSLRYLPLRFPCDQAPLLNAVVVGTEFLVGAHTQNHLPVVAAARNPLRVTAVANAHTHHTQVMRSPVHARNTNRMSFIQHQGFNLTTRVGSSVLKRTRKSLKSTCVSWISPSALLTCAFRRSKSEPEKHWLQDKGRIYGRYVDMWGHVDAMLNDGFARDPDLSDSDYTSM